MADYIDREDLLKKAYIFDTQSTKQWVDVADIKAMPSVDAVEVVRCKDCKYRNMNYAEAAVKPWITCRMLKFGVEIEVDDDFYCKWGEKE